MARPVTITKTLLSGQVLTPTSSSIGTYMLYSSDNQYRTNIRPMSTSTSINALCVENAYTKEIRWVVGGTPSTSIIPTTSVVNAQLVRGNLVASNVIGGAIFSSGLPDVNSSPNVMKLNADGSLSIIDPSNTSVEKWRSFVYKLSEGQTVSSTMVYSTNNQYMSRLAAGKFQIVERATNIVKWSTETWTLSGTSTVDPASQITAVKFQGGNLIGTNASGGVLLHTGLPEATGSYFLVDATGTASVYSAAGVKLWSTYCSLFPGQKLGFNQSLYNPDKTRQVAFGNFTISSTRVYLQRNEMSTYNTLFQIPIVQTSTNTSQFDWTVIPYGGDVSSDGYMKLMPSGELAMFHNAVATKPFWKTAMTGGLGPVGLHVTAVSGVTYATLSLLNSMGTAADAKLWENGTMSTSKFKTELTTNDGVVMKPFSQATFGLYDSTFTYQFQLTDDGRLQVIDRGNGAVIWSTSTWNLPGTSVVDPASKIVSASMSPVLTGYNSSGGVVFRANSTSTFASFTLKVQSTGLVMTAVGGPAAWTSKNSLAQGQKLMRGQSIRSLDGTVEFIFHVSGSLMVQMYAKTNPLPATPSATVWSTLVPGTTADSFVTVGAPGSSVSGQLVVYANASALNPLWSSGPLTQSAFATLTVVNATSLADPNGVVASVQLVSNTNIIGWANGGITTLKESMTMQAGDRLVSSDGIYECVLTSDGLFQIRNVATQAVTWSTATWPLQWTTTGAIDPLSKITSVKMTQGNLVGLNSAGTVIFDAGITGTNTSNVFQLSFGDGVVVNSSGTPLWRTTTSLYPGQKLMRGQSLYSLDYRYQLKLDQSGQLLFVTAAAVPTSVTVLWAGLPTGVTPLTENSYLTITSAGDLVIHRSAPETTTSAVWWSVTDYGAPTRLYVSSASGSLGAHVFFMGQPLLSSTAPIWTNGKLILPTLASGAPVPTVTELSAASGNTTLEPFSTNPKCVVSSDNRYMCYLTNDGRFRIVDTIAQPSYKNVGFNAYQFFPQTVKWSVGGFDGRTDYMASSIVSIAMESGNLNGRNKSGRFVFSSHLYVPVSIPTNNFKFIVNTDGSGSIVAPSYSSPVWTTWTALYAGQTLRPGDTLFKSDKTNSLGLTTVSATSVRVELKMFVQNYVQNINAPSGMQIARAYTFTGWSPSINTYLTLLPNGQLVLKANTAVNVPVPIVLNNFSLDKLNGTPYDQSLPHGFPYYHFGGSLPRYVQEKDSRRIGYWNPVTLMLADTAGGEFGTTFDYISPIAANKDSDVYTVDAGTSSAAIKPYSGQWPLINYIFN